MKQKVRCIVPAAKGRGRTRRAGRTFDVLPDVPDIRDRIYEPTLAALAPTLPPPRGLTILDQGSEGACTGFALAAGVNLLLSGRGGRRAAGATARRVSPHMLYEMAKRHDEWPREDYDGSSLRGALRGFFNCGACAETLWPEPGPGGFSLASAKDARRTSLGAYYRLRPHLPDYHAAIAETGMICAAAAVHAGWDDPRDGRIKARAGGALHAFLIVGYDDEGFWVQNSWGPDWGRRGLAHWSYADWAANVEDAWVLQLAVPAPSAFGLGGKRERGAAVADLSGSRRKPPPRADIAGHFVHVENGSFSATQPYWSTQEDVAETASLIAKSDKYRHFAFYAHGGLNTPDDAAIRTAAMAETFMANDVYPYSVFYDTGLLRTLRDVIAGKGAAMVERTGGLLDLTDALIEKAVGGVGTKLWDEMKADASLPFASGRDGELALRLFARALEESSLPIHLVGHSTGAILIGHLLQALDRIVPGGATVASVSLMAPACSIDFYRAHYLPRLGPDAALPVRIAGLKVYNLTDADEQDDGVTPFYNKSLLYLVSNAFERRAKEPLLGLQKRGADQVEADPLSIVYARTAGAPSQARSHGGFDNDPDTMNDVLRTILGKKPARPFSRQNLDY